MPWFVHSYLFTAGFSVSTCSPLPFAHPSSPVASAEWEVPLSHHDLFFGISKADTSTVFRLCLTERLACPAEPPQGHLSVPRVAVSHHQLAASSALVINIHFYWSGCTPPVTKHQAPLDQGVCTQTRAATWHQSKGPSGPPAASDGRCYKKGGGDGPCAVPSAQAAPGRAVGTWGHPELCSHLCPRTTERTARQLVSPLLGMSHAQDTSPGSSGKRPLALLHPLHPLTHGLNADECRKGI